jgi:septum site-determining protein MinC
MPVTKPSRTRPPIRFRGRSFLALVLAPEPPVDDWLAELDALTRRSPAFFDGRPVILELTGWQPKKPELTSLISDLNARSIRIMAVEGADVSMLGLGLPPPLSGGRPVDAVEVPEEPAPTAAQKQSPATPQGPSLLLDTPVRSGQSIIFPEGDVTVVGSVASGAEIIAGGSIHVYGALRGRAVAGSTGNARARIYCRKLEAELLAIDGLYKTADDMGTELRGRPIQAWLDGDAIMMAAMD